MAVEDLNTADLIKHWDRICTSPHRARRASQMAQWERICLQCRRHGFDPWVRRSSAEGNGNPFQYSCLENPMNRGAWQATVHESMQSRFSCVRLFATLWTRGGPRQAPLSMRFSRHKYWSGLPWPPPGDLPDPRIKPASLMFPASVFFTTRAIWEARATVHGVAKESDMTSQ